MIDRAALKSIRPVYRAYQLYRYLSFQPRLAAAVLRDLRERRSPGTTPLPPARLRFRVHGSLDRDSFVRNGRIIAEDLTGLLASVGREPSSFRRILDFGSGSGRVLRHFREQAPGSALFGTDIDPELVGWCEAHMPGVYWSRNEFLPPAPFATGFFDLVYSISVFTHLDEDFQLAWLRELHRIAAPGAMLIASVHGEHVYRTLASVEQQQLDQCGFLFLRGATGRLKLDGLPDFYQTAYHTEPYIRRVWGEHFEILHYGPRAINGHQDAVVLRKPIRPEPLLDTQS